MIKTPNRCHQPRSEFFIVNFGHVILVPLMLISARNSCYGSLSTVFIVSFEHILYLVLMFLLLILSMYLIAGFGFSYFSRFQIKMNSNFIVYSFLERISTKKNICTKWNSHPLASSSNQDIFKKYKSLGLLLHYPILCI